MLLASLATSFLLAVGAAAAGTVICSSSVGPRCFRYAPRPRTIYFGADGRFSYTRLHWQRWGGGRAVAHGVRREVFGAAEAEEVTTSPARLVARHPALCNGRKTYTELVVHSAGKPVRHFSGCTLEF